MRVKKYLARTLPEVMAQVKADLGPDAVILYTNEVKVGGIFGLFGKRMIQVMAAVEHPVTAAQAARAATAQPPLPQPRQQWQAPLQAPVQPFVQNQPQFRAMAAAALPESEAVAANLAVEVAGMKAMMTEIMDHVTLPAGAGSLEPELRDLVFRMLENGVTEPDAYSLIKRVRTRIMKGEAPLAAAGQIAREMMQQELGRVRPVDPGRRVVTLIGPTGVGKTTTLAKLAAHFALQRRLQVALITADTYRIAAADQLRTYCDIIGVPLETVYEVDEIRPALQQHGHRDLILVDTAGRSPKNREHMEELKRYLDELNADETYLVMSLTSGYRDAVNIVEHYLPMGFDHFLFTKWDETVAPGLIYSLMRKYKLPLSYVTTGQSVPDDIEMANPEKITRAILGD